MKQLLQIVSILLFFGGVAIAQPTVTSVSPTRNAIDISKTSNIVINFSETMDALGAIQPDAVTVRGSIGGKYTTQKSLSGFNDVLTIDPDSSFIPGEIITVFISGILNDENNGAIDRFSYQFRVENDGTGVGYFSNSDTFTGSIGDNGANMTYMGDLDGDGDADAIVLTRTASDLKFYVLYKQDGSDSYLTPSAFNTYDVADGSNPQGATLNDIDGDGDLDFVIFINPGANTRSFYVFTNNGSGTFTSHPHGFHSNLPTTSIGGGVFADVTRNDINELFILADNVYGMWPFSNSGGGTPAAFTEGTGVGQYSSIAGRFAVSRDFNNDDYPDFAIVKKINFSATPTNDSLGVILSDGSGGYTSATYNVTSGGSVQGAWGMDAGDFDGDGYVDLAIVTNDSLYILDNNQDGTFAEERGFNRNFASGDLKAADMDNDGDLDLVSLGSYTSVYYNDGSGDFSNPFGFSRGYGNGIVPALADADGDGDMDIIYSVNGTMTVLRNGLISAPTLSSSISSFTNNYGTSVQVNWTGGNGAKTLLIAKEGSAVDASPVDNTEYTADAVFGSGTEISSGNFVVYSGNGSNVTITGLNPDSTYHFKAIEFNNAGSAFAYRTSVSTGSVTVNKYPTSASSITIDRDFGTQLELSWSGGNGQNQLVAIREGSAITWTPDDSTTYTSISDFGSATDLGDGTKIISNGTSGTVTVTGLSLSTTYYISVFDYNGSAGSENYLTSSVGTASKATQGFEGLAFDSTAGYAYRFDGGNTYDSYSELYTDGNVIIDNAFTTELWIKPDSLGIQQYILSWYEEELVVGINSSNQLFGFHSQKGSSSTQITVTGTTTLTKGVWYHVALTGASGGNLTLYVNGVAEASAAVTDVSGDEDYDDYWYLGSEYAENNYFYGSVDELRIWSDVRTATEIRSFMHRPYVGLTTNLGGYWQFNEGTGDSNDELNNYSADNSGEDGWEISTAPVGSGSLNIANSALSGTVSLGNISLDLTDGFDNAVDVYAFEIESEPSVFGSEAYYPASYNSLFGDSRFIINVFGTPGTFSANMTLNFGSNTIPAGYDSTPDSLKLFTRSSGSESTWDPLGGANSVSSAAGTATWIGLTSFSQFGAVDTSNQAPATVTFTKSDYADATQEANQDRIAYNIWLTRGDDQGIFNANRRSSFSSSSNSPIGTLWSFGNTNDVESLTFEPWKDAVNSNPPESVGKEMVLWLYEHNEYIDIKFTSWTQNGNGGGFSYIRSEVDIPDPSPITFDSTAGFALDFDGVDDFATHSNYFEPLDDDFDLPNPITFEMWVNPDTLTDGKMVLAATWGTGFQMGIDSTDNFYASVRENVVGSNKRVTSTTSAVQDQWFHFALSYSDNDFIRLYINGVLEDSVAIAGAPTSSSAYYIGKSRYLESGGYHFFDGKLDEFRIWQEVRSDSAIRASMFTSNINADRTEIFAYWQMNEGSGTTVDDLANFKDLSLDGPSWVTSGVPIGGGTPSSTSNFQSGSVNVGNAALSMADDFDNPVDIQVTEVTGSPNVFPAGFTSGIGGKYFVINLFGNPGTFSASLTLNYGAGVLTSSTLSEYKLYKRGSNSTGAWTEVASTATSVNTSTGAVTWSGITAFSQFMGVQAQPEFDIQITDGADVVAYFDSNFVFGSDFFDLTGDYSDSTLIVTLKDDLSGILFVDTNGNNSYDDGTDNQVTTSVTQTWVPTSANKLVYDASGYDARTASIKLTLGESADSVSLDFFNVMGNPSLAGNTGENGWYLLANPFTTTIGDLLSEVWTQGAINSSAPSADKSIYTFIQDSAQYLAISTDLDTTKVDAGEGLLVYLWEDDDLLDGQSDVDGGWPKTLANYGNPFGVDVTVPVKNVDYDGTSGTSGSEGFVLFGNPYGWPIAADSVIATLKRTDELANSYVYRWNPTAKTYQIVSSGAINPYESVFIRMITSGASGSLAFDFDDADASINAKSIPDERFNFMLSKAESNLESEFALRFDEHGNTEIDPYDGYYLGTYASSFANLYTLIGDQGLSINNLPLNFAGEKEYPLYLHSSETGEFTLTWDQEALPEQMHFTLVNQRTGKEIDLKKESTTTFTLGAKTKSANKLPFNTVLDQAKSKQTIEPVLVLRVTGTAVSNEDDLGIPREVELYQNYPNPFNPSSVIRYGVPEQSLVQLEVFDVLGRKVMTLIDGEMKQPGRYNISFNARDLASGMYIYRLVIGENVLTKKMMLIK